jgi:hypothetical protein
MLTKLNKNRLTMVPNLKNMRTKMRSDKPKSEKVVLKRNISIKNIIKKIKRNINVIDVTKSFRIEALLESIKLPYAAANRKKKIKMDLISVNIFSMRKPRTNILVLRNLNLNTNLVAIRKFIKLTQKRNLSATFVDM